MEQNDRNVGIFIAVAAVMVLTAPASTMMFETITGRYDATARQHTMDAGHPFTGAQPQFVGEGQDCGHDCDFIAELNGNGLPGRYRLANIEPIRARDRAQAEVEWARTNYIAEMARMAPAGVSPHSVVAYDRQSTLVLADARSSVSQSSSDAAPFPALPAAQAAEVVNEASSDIKVAAASARPDAVAANTVVKAEVLKRETQTSRKVRTTSNRAKHASKALVAHDEWKAPKGKYFPGSLHILFGGPRAAGG